MTPMDFTPQHLPITCELNGNTYQGKYWVAGKIITVATGLGGKSTQVGENPPEEFARQLLRELASAGKA